MELDEFLTEWHNEHPTVMVHTSGSTGTPKPIWVEKRRMLNSARITCDFLKLKPHDTALLCMPLDFIAGKMMVVRSLERHLQLLNVRPSGHPLSDASLSMLDNPLTAITFAAMIPLQVYNSLQIPEETERLRRIKHLIIGGGAIDDSLSKALQSFPNAVWSTYGMTETLSHIALRRLSGGAASGWYEPFDSVSVSLNDDGCLIIDAPLVCDGLLLTNDRAELRKVKGIDGGEKIQFRIIGRKDNVINSGGIKIQIEEVEKALRQHLKVPYVITKRPNKKFGEEVVLLTESADLPTVRDICTSVLPKYWQPHHYQTISTIPTTGTGKIAREKARLLVE